MGRIVVRKGREKRWKEKECKKECMGGKWEAGSTHKHNAHHAPRVTAGGVLNGQRHFNTPVVLDSKRACGCEAGWQKHTRLAADDWHSFSSLFGRRGADMKWCSRDDVVSSFSASKVSNASLPLSQNRCR